MKSLPGTKSAFAVKKIVQAYVYRENMFNSIVKAIADIEQILVLRTVSGNDVFLKFETVDASRQKRGYMNGIVAT